MYNLPNNIDNDNVLRIYSFPKPIIFFHFI